MWPRPGAGTTSLTSMDDLGTLAEAKYADFTALAGMLPSVYRPYSVHFIEPCCQVVMFLSALYVVHLFASSHRSRVFFAVFLLSFPVLPKAEQLNHCMLSKWLKISENFGGLI